MSIFCGGIDMARGGLAGSGSGSGSLRCTAATCSTVGSTGWTASGFVAVSSTCCFPLATLKGVAFVGGSGEAGLCTSSATGVEGPDALAKEKRGLPIAGDRFEGNVLLLFILEVGGVAKGGMLGLAAAPERRERREDVETFRRTPPYLRKLSAPALELVEAERRMPELLRRGVLGVRACGVDGPLSTCFTVPSSTAVPSIPIKKWSWLSMRKINTSWLSR